MNKLHSTAKEGLHKHTHDGLAKKKQKQEEEKNLQGQDFLVFFFLLFFRVFDRFFFANKNKSHTQKANNECRLSLFRNIYGYRFLVLKHFERVVCVSRLLKCRNINMV